MTNGEEALLWSLGFGHWNLVSHVAFDPGEDHEDEEDGEDGEHDVEVAALVGLVEGLGGGAVGLALGDDDRLLVAGGADGAAFEHDHGLDGSHAAAVGAAGFGGGVGGLVLAVAVL